MNCFKTGFAKVNIVPSYPVPLAGYGNSHKRLHENVLDPLYAICIAVSDGENTLLLYHLDLTGFPDENVAVCKDAIEKTYGIPKQNVLFNSTHNHSAPHLLSPLESIKVYTKELHEKLIGLAAPALADLEESTIMIGSGKIEGHNYVRRYLLSDGSYGGDNFGDFENNTILAHETEADNTMQAVRFVRKTKKDIVMVNWQGHPHLAGGTKSMTSDLVEHFRNTVEAEHDVHMAFYQGCGGNLNSHSRIPGENRDRDHVKAGRELAAGLTPILAGMRPVKCGSIKTSITTFTGPVNHSLDHKLDIALKVLDMWEEKGVREANVFARANGFNSVYHANAVKRRYNMPETHSYQIGAVSFGDVCIAWAPNELYDTTGMFLKASSPFEMTFVCGYTNGSNGYMPTIKAYAHGGYGCDTCRFPAGVTEKLTMELLGQMVNVK
ncbi:MAG: hypothetical protein E7463_11160 [Ruminococcaceae bacterium]|nr:hypothetical protein [Oscillospiraceae bacterium]